MASAEGLMLNISERDGAVSPHELMGNSEYEGRRKALLRWAGAFKAERRVSLGSDFTLLFENRATVWLQVQEELRWIAHRTPRRVESILAEHNGLVPHPGQLCASLFINTSSPESIKACEGSSSLGDLQLALHLGGRRYDSRHVDEGVDGFAPVTYIAFVPLPGTAQGADRLTWSLPTAGVLTLSPKTIRMLVHEVCARPRRRHGPRFGPVKEGQRDRPVRRSRRA